MKKKQPRQRKAKTRPLGNTIHPTKGRRRTKSFEEYARIVGRGPRNKASAIMMQFMR